LFRRRRIAKQLEQINLLELTPVRLQPWSEVGGRVVVERRKPEGPGKLGERLRFWLAVRRIRLDEQGSHAWKLLDGERSVAEVAEGLRAEFGEGVEPAEERTGHLIRMLHQQELVAYAGWDAPEPAGDPDRLPL
jgi:hypothetical protein